MESIQKVIDCLDEYSLTKEDWETIIELGMGSKFEAAMKKINSKTKTNLTKRFALNYFIKKIFLINT